MEISLKDRDPFALFKEWMSWIPSLWIRSLAKSPVDDNPDNR
jgi:hypothetical protein